MALPEETSTISKAKNREKKQQQNLKFQNIFAELNAISQQLELQNEVRKLPQKPAPEEKKANTNTCTNTNPVRQSTDDLNAFSFIANDKCKAKKEIEKKKRKKRRKRNRLKDKCCRIM